MHSLPCVPYYLREMPTRYHPRPILHIPDSRGDADIRLSIGGWLDGRLLACFRPHRGYGLVFSGGVVDWVVVNIFLFLLQVMA